MKTLIQSGRQNVSVRNSSFLIQLCFGWFKLVLRTTSHFEIATITPCCRTKPCCLRETLHDMRSKNRLVWSEFATLNFYILLLLWNNIHSNIVKIRNFQIKSYFSWEQVYERSFKKFSQQIQTFHIDLICRLAIVQRFGKDFSNIKCYAKSRRKSYLREYITSDGRNENIHGKHYIP